MSLKVSYFSWGEETPWLPESTLDGCRWAGGGALGAGSSGRRDDHRQDGQTLGVGPPGGCVTKRMKEDGRLRRQGVMKPEKL